MHIVIKVDNAIMVNYSNNWPQSHSEFLKRKLAGTRMFPKSESTWFKYILEYINEHKEWLLKERMIRANNRVEFRMYYLYHGRKKGHWVFIPARDDNDSSDEIVKYVMVNDNAE